MAAAQESDADDFRIRSSLSEILPLAVSDSAILCGTSTGVTRPLVPIAFWHPVFGSFTHFLTQAFVPRSIW